MYGERRRPPATVLRYRLCRWQRVCLGVPMAAMTLGLGMPLRSARLAAQHGAMAARRTRAVAAPWHMARPVVCCPMRG